MPAVFMLIPTASRSVNGRGLRRSENFETRTDIEQVSEGKGLYLTEENRPAWKSTPHRLLLTRCFKPKGFIRIAIDPHSEKHVRYSQSFGRKGGSLNTGCLYSKQIDESLAPIAWTPRCYLQSSYRLGYGRLPADQWPHSLLELA